MSRYNPRYRNTRKETRPLVGAPIRKETRPFIGAPIDTTSALWLGARILFFIVAAAGVLGFVFGAISFSRLNSGFSTSSIEVECLTQEEIVYVEDGQLLSTHNLQLIDSTTGTVSIEIPEDLTEFEGKSYKVCSSNMTSKLSTLGGATFESEQGWQSIRLPSSCCVDFDVIQGNILVTSLPPCAAYCATSDQFQCVNPSNPEGTNPFHGWWVARAKHVDFIETASQVFVGTSYIHIDATQNPYVITDYLGTLFKPVEMSIFRGPGQRNWYPFNERTLATQPGPYDLDNPLNFIALITLSEDGQRLSDYEGNTDAISTIRGRRMEKIEEDLVPPIASREFGSSNTNPPSDPRNILRTYAETMLFNSNLQLATAVGNNDFIGFKESLGLVDQIIDQGISHTTPIDTIFATRSEVGLTIIRTAEYHHTAPVGKLEISGCTGDWAALNGIHRALPSLTTNPREPNPEFVDFGPDTSMRSIQYDVGFYFNSSLLSADADGIATSTGPCELTVTYGPLNGLSTYEDTAASVWYWYYETIKNGIHNTIGVYFDAATEFNDGLPRPIGVAEAVRGWPQVKSEVSTDDDVLVNVQSRFYTSYAKNYVGMASYTSFFYIFGLPRSATRFTLTYPNVNNRFGIRPLVDSRDVNGRWYYDISRQNYLQDVVVPYVNCEGNTRTDPVNDVAALQFGTAGCDTLTIRNVPFGTLPPPGFSFFNNFKNNDGDFPYNVIQAALPWFYTSSEQVYLMGRVDPAYTGGTTIGYFRLSAFDMDQGDITQSKSFNPPNMPDSVRRQSGAYRKIMAEMMEYLVTGLGSDHIIIDIRGNVGGSNLNVALLREFFGEEDFCYFDGTAGYPVDYGSDIVYDLDDMDFEQEELRLSNLNETQCIFTSSAKTLYPGSVFQGGEVIILTDTDAGSAGDVFPGAMLNSTLGRDLGADTHLTIFGDIDGRLQGGFGQIPVNPVSDRSPFLVDASGEPVSTLQFFGESFTSPNRADGSTFSNQIEGIKPDCAPSLTGKSGGCPLPNDEDVLVHPDLGFTPNPRPRLAGDTRPQTPDPNVRSEYRDAWLEQAIELAVSLGSKKKKRRSHGPKVNDHSVKTVSKKEMRDNMMKAYKRQVECTPGNENLMSLDDPSLEKVVFKVPPGERGKEVMRKASDMLQKELQNGGICKDFESNRMMATPLCESVPVIRLASQTIFEREGRIVYLDREEVLANNKK